MKIQQLLVESTGSSTDPGFPELSFEYMEDGLPGIGYVVRITPKM